MKINIFIISIALIIGATACSVVESDNGKAHSTVVFRANSLKIVDEDATTKTYVQPVGDYLGYDFFWSEKDTVGVFPSSGCQIPFELASGADASYAVFSAGAWTCKTGFSYRSYFPFIDDYHLNPAEIPVSFLGQKQIGNDNSNHFREYDYMFTGITESVNDSFSFSYHHLISGILVWAEVPASHYTSVTLTVDDPIFITEGRYDLNSANPAIVGEKFSNSIHVDLDITLENTDILKVYILNAPIDLSGRTVSITITNNDGFAYMYSYTPSRAFVAENIYRMRAAVDSIEENIVFADDRIKGKLVASFDSNGDGEISHEEAIAVTSIQDVFGEEKDYTSFDEFRYFTGVTNIPNGCFEDWTNLTSIKLPNSITWIGSTAFRNCSQLASIVIPNGVTSIYYATFESCSSLLSIVIPERVTSIGGSAFKECSALASVTIPESLTTINSSAFDNCLSVSSINVPSIDHWLGVVNEYGPLCSTNQPVHFYIAGEEVTSINIPVGTLTIPNNAFRRCAYVNSFTLPDSVSSIGDRSFEYCTSIKTINVPEGVTSIGNWAFHCSGLLSIIIPNSVTSIGYYAFSDCDYLTTVSLSDGLTTIRESAFRSCDQMTSISIPGSIQSIDKYAFSECTNLTDITFNEGLVSLGSNAFYLCTKLAKITLPSSIYWIYSKAFSGCVGLSSITINRASVPKAYDHVFEGSICPIIVPDGAVEAYKTAWTDYVERIQSLPEDAEIVNLQSHTVGSGVPIVIMGDGFTEEDNLSGRYESALNEAYNYFLSVEPMTSLNQYYDIWSIKTISSTSSFNGSTRLKCTFGSGTLIQGDDGLAYYYASQVVPSNKLSDMLVIVILNSTNYAGTCYMHYANNTDQSKSLKYSVAYVPMTDMNICTFEEVLHHEACGHGFGKLADEYYSGTGTIPESKVTELLSFQNAGAYINVDVHNDVSKTLWADYAADGRFASEQLGAYAGAYTYFIGVYRPTMNSIMNNNKGIFNAPSRAQIYKRTMSIANDWNWTFDYEAFVEFDRPIRDVIYNSLQSKKSTVWHAPMKDEEFIPLAPPVFVQDN